MIEVRPGPLSNQGGALMLQAIVQELGDAYELVVEPWIGPYPARARLGLRQLLWIRSLGPAAGLPARLLPRTLRMRYGIVDRREVDVVLDASGYAFGDPFDVARVRRLSRDLLRAARRGNKVVLLPQAFGPFEREPVRDASRAAIDAAELVYARDPASRDAVLELGAARGRVRLAPDFTGALAGIPPPEEGWGRRVAIVPNERMIGSGAADEQVYHRFLRTCAGAVRDAGYEPVLVVHEGARDRAFLGRGGHASFDPTLPQVVEADPLRLKGLLGATHAVVSGRYHALASALAQGVPVLATGWSHKYRALLDEYGVADALLDPTSHPDAVRGCVAELVDPGTRPARSAALVAAAGRRQIAVEAMWREVRTVIASGPR